MLRWRSWGGGTAWPQRRLEGVREQQGARVRFQGKGAEKDAGGSGDVFVSLSARPELSSLPHLLQALKVHQVTLNCAKPISFTSSGTSVSSQLEA